MGLWMLSLILEARLGRLDETQSYMQPELIPKYPAETYHISHIFLLNAHHELPILILLPGSSVLLVVLGSFNRLKPGSISRYANGNIHSEAYNLQVL